MIKSNCLDKKAQILDQYVPGCLEEEGGSGGRGGRGGARGGKPKRGGAGGRSGPGAGANDSLDGVVTDMKAKLGMGKIASNSLDTVLDLLKHFQKTQVFKNSKTRQLRKRVAPIRHGIRHQTGVTNDA